MSSGKNYNKRPTGKLKMLMERIEKANADRAKAEEVAKGGPDTKKLDARLKAVYMRKYNETKKELTEAEEFARESGGSEINRLTAKEISDYANEMGQGEVAEVCRQNNLPNPYNDATKYGAPKEQEAKQENATETKTGDNPKKDTKVQPAAPQGLVSNLG